MQEVVAIRIKWGFELDYVCDSCLRHVLKKYIKTSFMIKTKTSQYDRILCPYCQDEKILNKSALNDYELYYVYISYD